MLSKIKVYGKLAKFVGQRTFEAEINNTVDAIRFLIANYPRLQSHMLEQNYFIKVGEYQIDDKELDMPIGQQEIKIVPVAIGAGRGFGKFLGGRLIEAFEKKSTNDANEMAINLFLYAGSRTASSSPHIKASDVSSL